MQAPTPALDPPPVIGNDTQPGYWAWVSVNGDWFTRGIRPIGRRPGSKIHTLRQLPLRREPGLRIEGRPLTGPQFFTKVNKRLENVESLVAQSVGIEVLPGQECDSCKRKMGPFTSCVIVPSLGTMFPSCANCHWSSKGRRCSFIAASPPSAALIQPAPIQPAIIQPTLAQAALAQAALVDPAIVDPANVDPANIDPALI
ncbi:hypothetical protein N7466_010803 [Penicillium verhagenii]|uniref:uncharacterized protein n=1 Tax=Penicillium verhagenii TaxID=1562060 RepID=UPI00254544CD|nr:uncharacterized protein N7466_010803 [Penicillium verhagenii]KAJ5917249.1 hypothetical protein N7466_010803 [Penicillium verhagenii]